MRYSRVPVVVGLLAAVGLATIAVARTSGSPAASHVVTRAALRQAVQQAAQQYLATQRHVVSPRRTNGLPRLQLALPPRLRKLLPPQLWAIPPAPLVAPPTGGTTCYVATQCSIRPCVVPVQSNPSTVVTVGPAVGDAVGVARTTRTAPPAVVRVLPNGATGCPPGDRAPKTFRVAAAP